MPGGMELLCGGGRAPRFPFKQFVAQRREYEADNAPPEWTSIAELSAAARVLCPGNEGALLGHIGRRPALDWLGWKRGVLYAVGYGGDVLFCTSRGTVVAGPPWSGGLWWPVLAYR